MWFGAALRVVGLTGATGAVAAAVHRLATRAAAAAASSAGGSAGGSAADGGCGGGGASSGGSFDGPGSFDLGLNGSAMARDGVGRDSAAAAFPALVLAKLQVSFNHDPPL